MQTFRDIFYTFTALVVACNIAMAAVAVPQRGGAGLCSYFYCSDEMDSEMSEYEAAWRGSLAGGDCYFVPDRAVRGDFFAGPAEELFVIDVDGFGHFLQWYEGGMHEWWATDLLAPTGIITDAVAAGLNGGGTDSVVMLDPGGLVSVLGSESADFQSLCSGCLSSGMAGFTPRLIAAADYDGDSVSEIAAWGVATGSYMFSILKWDSAANTLYPFAIFDAGPVDEYSNYYALEPAAGAGPVPAFLLMRSGRGYGHQLILLRTGEQDMTIDIADFPPFYSEISPGGMNTSAGSGDFFLSFPLEFPGRLFVLSTQRDYSLGAYPGPPAGLDRYLPADLNGDGRRELFFFDVDCNFEIHADRRPAFTINGRPFDPANNLYFLSGGRVFIAVELFADIRLNYGGKTITLVRNDVTLILDRKRNEISILRGRPPVEEAFDADFIAAPPGGVFLPPEALEALGLDVDWDPLAERLEIEY